MLLPVHHPHRTVGGCAPHAKMMFKAVANLSAHDNTNAVTRVVIVHRCSETMAVWLIVRARTDWVCRGRTS